MKNILTILTFLFFFMSSYAQEQIEIEKQEFARDCSNTKENFLLYLKQFKKTYGVRTGSREIELANGKIFVHWSKESIHTYTWMEDVYCSVRSMDALCFYAVDMLALLDQNRTQIKLIDNKKESVEGYLQLTLLLFRE